MKTVKMLVILVLALTGLGTVAFSQPGQQVFIAYPVDGDPPVIDGVLDEDEYEDSMRLRVTFNDPKNPPGHVPAWLPAPQNWADLSYMFYAVYDEDNLYIAVDVRDDFVIDDGPDCWGKFPWYDDDVEIFVDGDRVRNDIAVEAPGKEGFQLLMDVGGDAWASCGEDNINAVIDWDAMPGLRRKGYLIEFRISLASIDTEDDGAEVPPGPGDSIGFNVAVGDDDNGSFPYNWGQLVCEPPIVYPPPDDCVEPDTDLTDSFGMWDGSDTFREDHWGTLVFASDESVDNIIGDNGPKLIAHWKLDETEGTIIYDSVSEIQADLFGDPIWQPTDGMVDGALMLDGIDDFVGTWSIPGLSDGELSVFAWVKGGAPDQVVVSQYNGVSWLMADASQGYLKTDLKEPGDTAQSLVSEVTITDGEWHHVGIAWDGTNRVLYVDDVAVASDTQTSLERSTIGLNIGCGPNEESGTFFSGLIDDVRIYDRAITP